MRRGVRVLRTRELVLRIQGPVLQLRGAVLRVRELVLRTQGPVLSFEGTCAPFARTVLRRDDPARASHLDVTRRTTPPRPGG
ncbi:hypothetical protein ACZ91_39290 [Streptomyces regensis]|nr:hypothetical protein ACZ91_39290 [Streptomyces regensis]